MRTVTIVRTMLVGVALIAASACSRNESPTSPTPTEPLPTTIRMTAGETRVVPDSSLRLTYERLEPPLDLARVTCLANAPCGPWGPSALMLMQVPERDQQRTPLYYREPVGGDRIAYAGYVVRLVRFEPEWREAPVHAPRDYVAVLEVVAQ